MNDSSEEVDGNLVVALVDFTWMYEIPKEEFVEYMGKRPEYLAKLRQNN